MIKFDKNEFLKPQIYSTLDEYETRCNITKEIVEEIEQLQQENQQLKIQISARKEEYRKLEDNWNELKKLIDIKLYNTEYLQKLCGCRFDDEIYMILDIIKKEIQELEEEV